MPKAVLEFDLSEPGERESFEKTVRADAAFMALWDIRQEIFRPARKHGYRDLRLSKLLDVQGGGSAEDVAGVDEKIELVMELERLFNDILRKNGLDHDDI